MKGGEIARAMDRMEDRKTAAGIGGPFGGEGTEEVSRRIFSGLDLDFAEIKRLMPIVARTGMGAMATGHHPGTVAAGFYFDGIATGLLIAEERAKSEGGGASHGCP